VGVGHDRGVLHPSASRVAEYDAFVRAHGGAVLRFLRRRTDVDTADDVLGDTMLVVWRRFADVPSEPLPWLYTTARNCLRDAQRAARRQQRLVSRITAIDRPAVSYDHPAEHADDTVHKALAKLREGDAELLRLWAWEELPPAQIAQVLGVSVNAATIRLHRAKKRLRAVLDTTEQDPSTTSRPEGAV